MILFFILAAMTLAAVFVLARPLLQEAADPGDARAQSLAMFQDQLNEVRGDETRGIIGAEEAAAARLEIERRILALAKAPAAETKVQAAPKVAAFAMAALIAVGAGGLYMALGSPAAADRAVAKSIPTTPDAMHAEMTGLIAKLSDRLVANPDDGEGWALLARSLVRIDQYTDAVEAYARARKIVGPQDLQLTAEYAEARVVASGGLVDGEAKTLFETLLRADERDPQARYYLALAQAQGGDLPGALAAWRALLADSPPDAPWRDTLLRQIAQAEGGPKTPPPAGLPGPSAEDIAAASKMAPGDQAAMIDGMVASLAAKLETNRDDVDGWRRLARAYEVLGKKDEALRAHREVLRLAPSDAVAKKALVSDAKK
jgi:cytochrome c-type biogenesis protein CcmH